jgi:hypothetical protein
VAEPSYVPLLLSLLAERGPLTTPALAASLGVPEAELQREVQARPDLFGTVDGWYSVWALAEGVVLTHMVSEEERASGMLVPDGDLDLWTRLADSPVPLVGGGEVQARYGADLLPDGASAVLVGPSGWLSGVAAGDLVAMRLVGGSLPCRTSTSSASRTWTWCGTWSRWPR